jgi:hypothetical protein
VPEKFNVLVKESGAGVTFDMGHAHVCEPLDREGDIYERYVLPNRDRILNAHIYHTEVCGVGHMAPTCLEDIRRRLDMLQVARSCNWWAIELKDSESTLFTRGLLNRYIESFWDLPMQSEKLPEITLSGAPLNPA